MQIDLRAVDSIRPYDKNPRKNDAAVQAVADSIRAYGFRQPVVVDKDGVIVVGHTRWKAARLLGLAEVPVHVADLTPEQAKAYRIADNRVNEIATWDAELLPGELIELRDLGIDLSALGFTDAELTSILAPPPNEGKADPDEVPPVPAEAVTRKGDLWTLGAHRLLCGDSTSADDVSRLMNGNRAALCATDPPYLVDYTGDRPNDSGKDWTATYHEIDITDADGFFRGVFTNVVSVLAPKAAIYCWHAHKRQALISNVWEQLNILDHQQIVWVKPSPVFGRVYWHFRHEPCMMGWVKGSQPEHDSDHTYDSVWEIDWEGKARVVGNEHPTQKPVEIFARPMRKHTKPGDICFEPFSGSGSQLVAAEQQGRSCYALEIEPVYVDAAVRRWERFSGKRATRVNASGRKAPGLPAVPAPTEKTPAGAGVEAEAA